MLFRSFALVGELQALLGEAAVRRRIQTEAAYQTARDLLVEAAPAASTGLN